MEEHREKSSRREEDRRDLHRRSEHRRKENKSVDNDKRILIDRRSGYQRQANRRGGLDRRNDV